MSEKTKPNKPRRQSKPKAKPMKSWQLNALTIMMDLPAGTLTEMQQADCLSLIKQIKAGRRLHTTVELPALINEVIAEYTKARSAYMAKARKSKPAPNSAMRLAMEKVGLKRSR